MLCFRRCACISTDACIHPLQVWLSTGRVSTRTHSLGEERMRAEPPHRRPTISALKVLRAPFQPLTHITPIQLSAASAKPSPLAYFSFSCVASLAYRSLYFPFVQHRQGRVTACFHTPHCHAPCRRPRRARRRRSPRRRAFLVRAIWQPFLGTSRTAAGSNFGRARLQYRARPRALVAAVCHLVRGARDCKRCLQLRCTVQLACASGPRCLLYLCYASAYRL